MQLLPSVQVPRLHVSRSSAPQAAGAAQIVPKAGAFAACSQSLLGVTAGKAVPEELKAALEGAAVAIWTTTGWTIPANQAVAVNERLQYALVAAQARPPRWMPQ